MRRGSSSDEGGNSSTSLIGRSASRGARYERDRAIIRGHHQGPIRFVTSWEASDPKKREMPLPVAMRATPLPSIGSVVRPTRARASPRHFSAPTSSDDNHSMTERQAEALSRLQADWTQIAIRSDSEAIRGTQMHSDALRCTQHTLPAILDLDRLGLRACLGHDLSRRGHVGKEGRCRGQELRTPSELRMRSAHQRPRGPSEGHQRPMKRPSGGH